MFEAVWSQFRSMWRILRHTFTRPETVQYPEQQPYLAPRYRGRIVLTVDPDGEERCVACNLCAVACPVDCIALQQGVKEDGRWYPEFFRINFQQITQLNAINIRNHQVANSVLFSRMVGGHYIWMNQFASHSGFLGKPLMMSDIEKLLKDLL